MSQPPLKKMLPTLSVTCAAFPVLNSNCVPVKKAQRPSPVMKLLTA